MNKGPSTSTQLFISTLLLALLSVPLCGFASDIPYPTDQTLRASWERLLHFEEGESRVKSDEFFLTPSVERTPATEFHEMVRLLLIRDGHDLACAFPARYEWLRENFLSIPYFDLDHCDDLRRFSRDYNMDKVSLVFVSELVDSPASAFGHLLLVIPHPNNRFLLSNVIHFAARTNGDNGFRYAYKGLNGGYDGVFLNDPLFERLSIYSTLEQRHAYFYSISLTPEQRHRLLLHLFELKKATFQYYFSRENCAFQIGILLEIALDESLITHKITYYALPLEIVRAFQGRLAYERDLRPSLDIANATFKELRAEEKSTLLDVVDGANPHLLHISDKVAETLVRHYEYRFRRQGYVYSNYADVMSLEYDAAPTLPDGPDRLHGNPPIRLGVGLHQDRGGRKALITFRPFLRDRMDSHPIHEDGSELSFMDVSVTASSDGFDLEGIDIVHVTSSPPRTELHKPTSWQLSAGLNKFNLDATLQFTMDAGIGFSYATPTGNISLFGNAGVRDDRGVIRPYVRPEFQAVGYTTKMLKVGFKSGVSISNVDRYDRHEAFLSVSMGRTALVGKVAKDDSLRGTQYQLVVYRYF